MNFIHAVKALLRRWTNLAFLDVRSKIASMIPRRLVFALTSALNEAPAVALLGPRKYGYPPYKQEKATETVLEQAALLSEEWATA